MPFLRNLPIKRKLTAIIMLTCCAALLLTCVAFVTYEQITFRQTMQQDLSTLTDLYDDNLASGLAFLDPKSLEQTLKSLDGNGHILAAAVYGTNNEVVAKYQRLDLKTPFPVPRAQGTGTHFEKDRLDAFRRVMLAGEVIGTIYIASDLRELNDRLWRYAIILGLILVVASLLALWLSSKLQRIISEPIFHLAKTAAVVAKEKNYSIRAVKHGDDELGSLIDGFNEMLGQIQSQNNALQEARENLEKRVEERTLELQLEIADRKDAQLTLAQQARLSSLRAEVGVALTRPDDLRTILKRCGEALVSNLGAAFARIWTLNARENVLELQASAGMYTHLDGPHGRVPVGKFKIGLIAQEAKSHVTNQVLGDPRVADQEWVKREGMVAFAGYPLIVEGQVVGVMAIFARHPLAENVLEALASIADGIGLGVVRKQAEEALTLLSSAIEQSADTVLITRRDGVIEYVNQALCKLTGYSKEEFIGQTPRILKSDQHRPAFYDELWKTILSGKLFHGEFVNRKKNGDLYSEEKTIGPVFDAKGVIIRFVATGRDITERKSKEAEMELLNRKLLEISRAAGMAEVATGVLHNVGNVLNSVNVSATLLADNLKKSRVANFVKVTDLLDEHTADLGAFIANDPKGKQLPGYLSQLAKHVAGEQAVALTELGSLRKNIEHIKDIVAMQQSYAKVSGVTELVKLTDLVEDALRMNTGALARHDVQVVREYEEVNPIALDKHKVLQILVNLIRNAKYACDESGRKDKQLTIRVSNGGTQARVAIADNGVGIPAENLTRIFSHGFTTRKDGHGFGLHSGALNAKEMGGALVVHSEGPGRGATFTLELPLKPPGEARPAGRLA